MNKQQKEKCIKIWKHYGPVSQFAKTKEELEELLIEIKSHIKDKSFEHESLIDELADVAIMIQQLSYAVGVDRVSERINFKLDRQLIRIDDGCNP